MMNAQFLKLLARIVLRGDITKTENVVHCLPIGVFENAVTVIIFCRLPRRLAGDDADGIDGDLAPLLLRLGFDLPHNALPVVDVALEQCDKKSVAISNVEGVAGSRGAGIHDDRSCATIWLWLGTNLLELDILAVEIELLRPRPHCLDRVEPFLGVFIPLFVATL